jgi:uncharacterized membrane protein
MSIVAYLNKPFHFYNNHRLVIFLILALFGIGVFFSSLIPPFQSPDEHAHLKRAYLLSKGRIVMETPEGESTGGYIDTGLNAYMGAYNHIPFNLYNKVTQDVKEKAAALKWSGEERFGSSPGINYYLPFIYLPQTVGLLIGQWADLTIEKSYYLARYLALLSSILIILFAFSIARVNVFVLAILSMPLMVFQLVSTSQDGFAIALLILTLSLFVKLTSVDGAYNSKYFYLMIVTILLLVTSRINLLPLLILPFAAVALTKKSTKEYVFSALITFFAMGWIIYALSTTVDNRVAVGAPTKEIIIFYLQQPFSFLTVLYKTLSSDELFSFYTASFVGVLGWLDTPLGARPTSIILYTLILVFFTSIHWREIKVEPVRRGVLILVAITSFLLTFFLLLITWTEHPATTVSGVQGRYLWGPALILAYGLTVPFYKLSKLRRLACVGGVAIIVSVVMFQMPTVLVERYYTNNTYSKKPQVKQNFEEISYSMLKSDVDTTVSGGFIDSASLREGGVELTGWGFFSTDEKQFFSNIDDVINIRYKTKLRQDVANTYKDDTLLYGGFTLFFEVRNMDVLKQLCLYTKDPIFGVKQLVPGNSDMLYKCAKK